MTINAQHIDEILAHLPRLENRQRLLDSNQKIKRADDCPAVCDFFMALYESPLLCHGYEPDLAHHMIQDLENLKKANLADIRNALTYCLRHQRWTDSWAPVIDRQKGKAVVIDLLKRLQEIREGM